MDAWQEKGLMLARDKRLHHVTGSTWVVPSQSTEGGAYVVDMAKGS